MKRGFLAAAIAASLSLTGGAQGITDCTCYDISRVDTAHQPRLVLRNQGARGWNLFDVSPDRTRVVFSHGDLEVADINGSRPRSLSKSAGNFAAFSPDGSLVAFSDRPGRPDALAVARVGGGVVRAFRGNVAWWAAWAPDSKRLAFALLRAPSSPLASLVVGDLANGQISTLTGWRRNLSGGTSIGVKASWSPDGTCIAYIEGFPVPRLHVLRLRDGRDRVIARGRAPVWSPDSQRIAFMRRDRELAVVNADGTNLRVVDAGASDSYFFGAAWSPRGSRIAYRRPSVGDDLWIARPDGTDRRRLTRGRRSEEIGPIYWSLDGQTILYTHIREEGD
jgi:Tol biopolymer transport system component